MSDGCKRVNGTRECGFFGNKFGCAYPSTCSLNEPKQALSFDERRSLEARIAGLNAENERLREALDRFEYVGESTATVTVDGEQVHSCPVHVYVGPPTTAPVVEGER